MQNSLFSRERERFQDRGEPRGNIGIRNASGLSASCESSVLPRIGRERDKGSKKEVYMLETVLVVLLILWALGFFAFHVGSLVHVLLVIALVVVIIRLLQGRKIL
jgi:hypothetical protein